MRRKGWEITNADLYLAFRQAKTALYFEKRGVGLRDLAMYERKLPANLTTLKEDLLNDQWFDNLDIGTAWLVPKRFRDVKSEEKQVVMIGTPQHKEPENSIEVQNRLTPSPEFAVAEVLYLRRFGCFLDSLLLNDEILGYRLDIREGKLEAQRRWLFEYWPDCFQKFRMAPLKAAKDALRCQDASVAIVSGDLASFYDTIDPSFLLQEEFLERLELAGMTRTDLSEFRIATESLLRAFDRFRAKASKNIEDSLHIGVPIGALTSRVIANLALEPLDRHIVKSKVLCYRRYVDDFVIVDKLTQGEEISEAIPFLKKFLPINDKIKGNKLYLNVDKLGRRGSEFQINSDKTRIHQLNGVQGVEFVNAIASDFTSAVSERRAFLDSAMLVDENISELVWNRNSEGMSLRALRDANRSQLERYSLSTSLKSLERISSLIDEKEARRMIRASLERIWQFLSTKANWVDDLDMSFRLLKIAISSNSWRVAVRIFDHMESDWGNRSLHSTDVELFLQDKRVGQKRGKSWSRICKYLNERRLEAIASVLSRDEISTLGKRRFLNVVERSASGVGERKLHKLAKFLALADLRSRDRESDEGSYVRVEDNFTWMRRFLRDDEGLSKRLDLIDEFVTLCEKSQDSIWRMPAARLFLCTRPPSYFDIARRVLDGMEKQDLRKSNLTKLLDVVNAVRGTKYRDPLAKAVDSKTIRMTGESSSDETSGSTSSFDPRIILGNLVVPEEAWEAAATRKRELPYNAPLLTLKRVRGLAQVIRKAEEAALQQARRAPALLVLPELSLPRSWFREVANYVAQTGKFGLVTGLEYQHVPPNFVKSEVVAVLPGRGRSAIPVCWTKRMPAHEEGRSLGALGPDVQFHPISDFGKVVVESYWGNFSVLVCSELIETRQVADLLRRVNLVLCPAWNKDTSTYDHLIKSVGLQLHSVVAVSNNGHYSDCRAWAPHADRWKGDLCRLIERDIDDVVYVDIPLSSLKEFHEGKASDCWKPLPPDWTLISEFQKKK